MSGRYGLEIRAANSADAAGISALLALAGPVIPPAIVAQRLDALFGQPGAALIAVDWGPPAGIVLVHWYRTLGSGQPVAQIGTLFVASDRRRHGIGRLLVKAAAQAARAAGCGGIEVLARAEQAELTAFCRESGFVEDGSRFVRALRKKA